MFIDVCSLLFSESVNGPGSGLCHMGKSVWLLFTSQELVLCQAGGWGGIEL
jgi:hypothetical protein